MDIDKNRFGVYFVSERNKGETRKNENHIFGNPLPF